MMIGSPHRNSLRRPMGFGREARLDFSPARWHPEGGEAGRVKRACRMKVVKPDQSTWKERVPAITAADEGQRSERIRHKRRFMSQSLNIRVAIACVRAGCRRHLLPRRPRSRDGAEPDTRPRTRSTPQESGKQTHKKASAIGIQYVNERGGNYGREGGEGTRQPPQIYRHARLLETSLLREGVGMKKEVGKNE